MQLVLLLSCLLVSSSLAQFTRIRLIPNGSSGVDYLSSLSLNGYTVLRNCTLGQSTRYIGVTAGDSTIVFNGYFGTQYSKTDYFDGQTDFTVYITPYGIFPRISNSLPETTQSQQFVIFEDTYSPAIQPQVRLIHGGYGVPPVNIYLDQALVASELAYTQSTGYAIVNEGTYTVKYNSIKILIHFSVLLSHRNSTLKL